MRLENCKKMGPTKLEEIFKNVMVKMMMSELNGDMILQDTQITETLLKNDIKNRFEEVYNIMQEQGLLPEVTPKPEKSDKASEDLRADGNQQYVKTKNNMEALRLYTKAICAARPESKEIALAYANRSAVTYDLEEFNDSIKDINRALSNGKYPDQLKAKLFERRGRCYMKLFQHAEALGDFHSAKEHLQNCTDKNKMQSSLTQIDNLIELCQQKPQKPQQKSKALPKLSHKPSSYITAASAAVDIRVSTDMGRHVVAAANIKPGDVLAIENPYVSILLPSKEIEFCHNCKRKSLSTVPCPFCIAVVFCSEECRQASWTEYHSMECNILPALQEIFGDDNTNGYLALRILLKASKCGANLGDFIDDYSGARHFRGKDKNGIFSGRFLSDYASTRELLTHEDSRSFQNKVHSEIIAVCIVHLLRDGTDFFRVSDSWPEDTMVSSCRRKPLNVLVAARMLVIYCMICSCNAHEIEMMGRVPSVDELNQQKSFKIGSALYPFHALMNHSCDPNVVRCIVGDKSYIFAVQPIQKGQQVFDSYKFLYTIVPLQIRQKYFKEKYFFTCHCIACREKWPLFNDLPIGPPKYLSNKAREAIPDPSKLVSTIAKTMVEIGKGNITEEQCKFLCQSLTLIYKNVQRPWKPYSMCLSSIKYFLNLKTYHLNN